MRLLLIEDYQPLRDSLVQGLSESGFAVDATGDGKEGLWYTQDAAYDAVVLDLMLPGMDGLSILRDLRKRGREYPVLILTAKDQVADRVLGLNSGADDYLVKPFAFEELLARVNALVRRKFQLRVPEVQVGDLQVDLSAKRAHWQEVPIDLTAKEFGVLEVLALSRGQVVSRTAISEHLYGFDAEPNSNAIDVYIAQLRRKLEAEARPRVLHTRRGLGYLLSDEEPCDH